MEVFILIAVVALIVWGLVRAIRGASQPKLNPQRIVVSRKAASMGKAINYRLDPCEVDDLIDPFLMFLIYECWADQINLCGYIGDDGSFYVEESFVTQFNYDSHGNFDITDYCDTTCEIILTEVETTNLVETAEEGIPEIPVEEGEKVFGEVEVMGEIVEPDHNPVVEEASVPSPSEHAIESSIPATEYSEPEPEPYVAPEPVSIPEPEPTRYDSSSSSIGSSDFSSGGGSDYSSSGGDCGGCD